MLRLLLLLNFKVPELIKELVWYQWFTVSHNDTISNASLFPFIEFIFIKSKYTVLDINIKNFFKS
jgi:hypothetical protein